jgi:hypothetical protein
MQFSHFQQTLSPEIVTSYQIGPFQAIRPISYDPLKTPSGYSHNLYIQGIANSKITFDRMLENNPSGDRKVNRDRIE